jgi:hypothetical protein
VRASLNAVCRLISIIALSAIALAGCAVRISSSTGSVTVVSSAPIATAVVVGAMAADGYRYYGIGPDGKTPMYRAPEPDPTRKINVQDCTRRVDPDAGNLMCR